MFNFIRLSEGETFIVPGSIWVESDLICELATRVLGSQPVVWSQLKDRRGQTRAG